MSRSIPIIVFVLVLMLGFQHSAALAQTEAEAASDALVLSSQKEGVETSVKVGRTINVKYTTDPRRFSNKRLDGVTATQVILSGDTIGLEYVQSVSVRNEKKYATGRKVLLASIIVTAACYLAAIVGIGLLFSATAVAAIFLVIATILAIPASVAMPAGFIVGLVLMGKASNTYDRKRGWKISTRVAQTPPQSTGDDEK